MLPGHTPTIAGGRPDPMIVTSATFTSNNSPVQFHNATLPGGIAAGDLLLFIASISGNSVLNTPSGWSALGSIQEGSANTDREIAAIWKTASGSEGATVSINLGTSNNLASKCYLIRRNLFSPQVSAGAVGVSAAPDSDGLSPSWGTTRATLWFSAMSHRSTLHAASAPSGYSSLDTEIANNLSLGVARKLARLASDNPGAFGVGGISDSWAAFTIGVA